MEKQSLKILKSITCFVLLITLLMADFIVLGQGIAVAVYENLEAQGNNTNIRNIEFDSYFLDSGEKMHYKECDLDAEETLIININVKESGVLKNAKIKIENANFELVTDKIQNSHIKSISSEVNEIELNEIIYQNDVIIEIPIKFKKEESFTDDYFERENTISLMGIYADEKEQEVLGQIKTKMLWKQQVDVDLSNKIEKYIDLGENGILLQQNVTTQVVDDKLPRENETLNLQVPTIDEQAPEEVVVLLNGEKLPEGKITYNEETTSLEIRNETEGTWGVASNEYKIIYKYSADIEFTTKTITLQTKMQTKLYMQDEIEKQEEQTIAVNSMGNAVSINKRATNSIYKGYMYGNSANETDFIEYNDIEVSDISSVNGIEIEKEQEVFINEQEKAFDVSEKMLYKATAINKVDFIRIFGSEGEILIKDKYDNILNVINQDTEVDESGNILIAYDDEIDYIKMVSSKPISEGTVTIVNARAIKGETGYTKEQLKVFSKLLTKTKVSTSLSEEISKAEVTLNDTKTEAKIEISNNNLSTLQNNENMQLLVTLKSNTAQYDLYKNPNIEIIFPKELEVSVKNITQLNKQEELKIGNAKLYANENGEQVISMQLQGEQITFENDINEGIQVSITVDINIDKATPSRADQIIMNYTNQNRSGEIFTTTEPINLNSKYGVLTVNKLSNYNASNDEIENIDSDVKTVELDTLSDSRDALDEISIVNNYETAITDVSIIGKVPDIGEEEINNEILKSNFEIHLKDTIQGSGNIAKVYYSEDVNADNDSNTWSENIADISKIKSFKIELLDNKIDAGSSIKLLYNIVIPEGLEENKSTYSNLVLNYNYAGTAYTTTSIFALKTQEKQEEKQQVLLANTIEKQSIASDTLENGMQVQILAKTAEGILNDGQDVMEGSKIKYVVNIINNSSEVMKNINIEATYENAILWEHNEYEIVNSHTCETETVTKYEENMDLNKETFMIEKLEAGESTQIEYQISVKEVEDDNQVLKGNIKIEVDESEGENIEILPNKIKQGGLNLKLIDSFYEQTDIYSTGGFPIELEIKNISDKTMKDVVVELPLTEEVYFTLDQFLETENVKFVEYTDKVVKFKIGEIVAGESVSIFTQLMVEEIPIEKENASTSLSFKVGTDDVTYYSNEVNRKFYQSETEITAVQTSNKEDEYIENGDKITFTTTIRNSGSVSMEIDIKDDVPDGAVIQDAYLVVNGEKEDVEVIEGYNTIIAFINIEANQTIQLVIDVEINTAYMFENSITNYTTITGRNLDLKTNEITYKLKNNPNNNPDDSNNDDPDSPNNDAPNSDNEDKTFSISGVAWIDSNKNGNQDISEEKLSGIEVLLLDSNSGNITERTNTDKDGNYNFNNIRNGSYIVVFKYDTGKYGITKYQTEGAAESTNSDVVSKDANIDGAIQKVAMTATLELKDADLKNIDAGFIQNEKFDLKLDKYINRIIVQNNKETTVKEYNNTQLVKIELDSKQIANTIVIIEYKIQITNEGELAGYVSEIVDYMPSDLSFSSEMNKNWYQLSDGGLYSKELSNEIINPGETKTMTLTLVKTMTQNNTGTSINTAEINKASNDFSIQDVDSTPGNKVSSEDDTSTASVIISIKTGGIIICVLLIMIIIVTIGIGVYFIKKKVIFDKKN